MNKIKISNEQERIKIEFDFDNVQVARQYFEDEECINDIIDMLDYEEEEDTEDEKQDNESSERIEFLKGALKPIISDASTQVVSDMLKIFDEELKSRLCSTM